jgi:hypothetical protein
VMQAKSDNTLFKRRKFRTIGLKGIIQLEIYHNLF